jgi:hypothetical protein
VYSVGRVLLSLLAYCRASMREYRRGELFFLCKKKLLLTVLLKHQLSFFLPTYLRLYNTATTSTTTLFFKVGFVADFLFYFFSIF